MKVKLGVDQIRFIVRFAGVSTHSWIHDSTSDTATYKAVWSHILNCKQDWKKGAKHWKVKNGAMTKSVWPLDGGSVLTVALGFSAIGKSHFMTVQFNPSRFTSDAASEMQCAFQSMFDHWYEEFVDRAECSYIETPLDVFGAKMADYLFFDTRLKSVNAFYEADGTLYLGSRTSSRYTTVYNKAKEIADTGGPVSDTHWLRIEPHRNVAISAWELPRLPCTFDTLQVIDRKKLTGIVHHTAVTLFRKRVFEQGMQPQYAYRMASDKGALLHGLKPAVPHWFKPQTFWQAFPAVVHRVTPAGLDELASNPVSGATGSTAG